MYVTFLFKSGETVSLKGELVRLSSQSLELGGSGMKSISMAPKASPL